MSDSTPWTWEQLAEMVKFEEGLSDRKEDKREKKLQEFIEQYEYAGALALEIARWCVRHNEPDVACYGPLCYIYPTSCSGCFLSFAGMCCSNAGGMKIYKKLAIEYGIEYYKVYGNV